MHPLVWLCAALAVVLVCGFCWLSRRHDAGPDATSPETRHADSLYVAAETIYVRTRDSLKTSSVADVGISREATTLARTSRIQAEKEHRRADSLAIAALAADDSTAAWRLAYHARTAEADTLRAAVVQLDTALRAMTRAHQADSARADLAEHRLGQADAVLALMRRDLAAASPPCRIVAHIPCPSRKVAFVTGTILGGVGAVVVMRSH